MTTVPQKADTPSPAGWRHANIPGLGMVRTSVENPAHSPDLALTALEEILKRWLESPTLAASGTVH